MNVLLPKKKKKDITSGSEIKHLNQAAHMTQLLID